MGVQEREKKERKDESKIRRRGRGNLSVIGNRLHICNRDTFFPDLITDLIIDLSDHPI